MTTLPEPPRSPLIDPQTGRLAREWVRFFDDLRRAIVSGLDDAVGGRLDALEAESLFGGSAEGGGSAGYNDAGVRGRLDDIETTLLFPDRLETQARMALIQEDIDQAMDAVFAPDHSAALRAIGNRLDALELAQILLENMTGRLHDAIRRLRDLETENAFGD